MAPNPPTSRTQPVCTNAEHEHAIRGDDPPRMVAFWGYWLCPLEDAVKVPPIQLENGDVIPEHEALIGELNRAQRRSIEKFGRYKPPRARVKAPTMDVPKKRRRRR